jgi:hypothetical protein
MKWLLKTQLMLKVQTEVGMKMLCEWNSSFNLLSMIVEPLKGATGQVADILSIRCALAVLTFQAPILLH